MERSEWRAARSQVVASAEPVWEPQCKCRPGGSPGANPDWPVLALRHLHHTPMLSIAACRRRRRRHVQGTRPARSTVRWRTTRWRNLTASSLPQSSTPNAMGTPQNELNSSRSVEPIGARLRFPENAPGTLLGHVRQALGAKAAPHRSHRVAARKSSQPRSR